MYLMHRMSHQGDVARELLFKNNYISIGWSDIDDEIKSELIVHAQSNNRDKFRELFVGTGVENAWEWMTARKGWYLYNFLALKAGDKVIVPLGSDLTICEVTGEPKINTERKDADLGFFIPVSIIETGIPRALYTDSGLSSKLKYRGSNLVLNDKDIDCKIGKMILDFNEKKPVHDFGDRRVRIVNEVHEYIQDSLKPDQFEKLVKAYFEHIGATRVEIPSKNGKFELNDEVADIDVKAYFKLLDLTIYVQVKHHADGTATGEHAIRQIDRFKYDGDKEDSKLLPISSLKWVITTASVDEGLIEAAKEKNIRVFHEKQFAELLVDAGFDFSDISYLM
ncbi:restriction endonuclease [Macrococcus brunensis]|uniref:restriction endonuclease n=1 Tax=Macrococcus brunensis TaxID=198483 RepID=UPI001EF137A1|nr:restriction endonuclease [Macrococcus brunensis]ULG71398.1 restriction endonuclease [Macrococcus brunensis]